MPYRERAACGLLLPPWARGCLLSALLLRLLQRPPPPRRPPLLPPRSLARRLSAPRLATVHYSDAAAASQPLKDKGPPRRSYPANPQPTTTRLICMRAAIGLCKSACSDNLTSAPGTRLRGAEEGGATRKASLGRGRGWGAGSRAYSHSAGRAGRRGGLCARRGGCLSLGWSWLPSVFLVGAHFFFNCRFMSFVLGACY